MKTAVLGDVGQSQYHVGDEAMAHAAVVELARRGADDLVILTRNVEETEREFERPARMRPDVPWNAFARHRAFEDLLSGGGGDLRTSFLRALDGCDALLIAGGGNLTSQYGGLLFERMAFAWLAAQQGLPVVVSGQTVGPVLTAPDAQHLAPVLSSAALVGARERETKTLLDGLGVSSTRVMDDATFLTSRGSKEGYIAVTLAPGSGAMSRHDYVETMARLVTAAARTSGLPVRFMPHVSTIGQHDGDVEVHSAVAELTQGIDAQLMPQRNALETAKATVDASLVLSTRYHPAVFAVGAGVPVLPVAVDLYGEARIGGALGNWGVQGLLRSLRHLGPSAEQAWVEGVWDAGPQIADHLCAARATMMDAQGLWWDAVAAGLRSQPAQCEDLPEPPVAEGTWARSSGDLDRRPDVLNASNELAIGNLLQHVDWLQGELRAEREDAAARTQAPSRAARLRRAARAVTSRLRRP